MSRPSFAREHHRFERDAVSPLRRPGIPCGWPIVPPPNCSTTSSPNRSSSWCIWPAWMPPEATGMTLRNAPQSCSKKIAAQQVDLRVRVAADVCSSPARSVDRPRALPTAVSGVNVVDADHAHPLGDDAEADTMILLPRIRAVPGAMQMQDHVVLAAPVRQRLDSGVADDQIDHDDDRPEFLGERRAPVHLLHVAGG